MNNIENNKSDSGALNKDQLLNLILEAREGSSQAFSELRARYNPLIESLVYKHMLSDMPSQDGDEIRQEALISFGNAVYSYDCENVGVEFGLYAKICIENRLISYKRAYLRRNSRATLPLEAAEMVPDVAVTDPFQMLIADEKTEELVSSIKRCLSNYENRVWWMYVSGMSVSEIAEKIQAVDAKSVSNAIYRIRKKLRAVVSDKL